jgi:NADH:ubiquinone oxidoreductase subunit B-like Fe-S oxidoreductase
VDWLLCESDSETISLVIDGLTLTLIDRLRRVYEQVPEPKHVIAVGACACSGGVFKGCYNVGQGIEDIIPVDMFIPGCPPRPEAIMYGVLKLLGEVK